MDFRDTTAVELDGGEEQVTRANAGVDYAVDAVARKRSNADTGKCSSERVMGGVSAKSLLRGGRALIGCRPGVHPFRRKTKVRCIASPLGQALPAPRVGIAVGQR